ncbi:MAG: hypothetical protein BGO51_14320 [Rhodospirillales bacterium 69-11]|nr:Hint domain-containing protein [Rhodospirillales bacterium]OJW26572.1 MAG: hypothetical protein BGO51_14320 [Rhodospirillales bacterium 69-11]
MAIASTHALDGLVLEGFGPGNSILEDGLIATDASWSATGDGIGTVTLTRNGTIVTTATLAGTYDGATFVVLPLQPTWQSSTALYLAEGTFGAGNAPPSAGVATADALGWVGGAGDWGDATHWRDLVTGGSVAAAPGIGNTATIALQDGANVLSGQGEAASLSLFGQMILSGNVTTGTLTLGDLGSSGRPVVWQGGTLVAGELDVPWGGVWAHGGMVSIAGTASVGNVDISVPGNTWIETGTLAAVSGGTLHIGGPVSLAAGLITLDDASVLEIGSGTTATAGTLTVDADGWIGSGSWHVGTIAGSAIRNAGTIAFATLEGDVANLGLLQGVTAQAVRNDGTVVDGVIGQVTGTGRIEVADTLELGAAAEQHVAFQDDSATLVLTAPDQAPVLDGFIRGDRIILKSVIATAATYAPTSDGMGRLDLLNGDTMVASLTLSGDYTGQTFYMGGSNVVTLAPPAPPPCFVTGTLIRTRRGEVPVDALQVGDEVATRLPLGFRPIRWIGRRTLRPGAHPDPAAVRPIRIRAGAFGRTLPRRDLLLSPDHALYLDDVLIPVKLLVDGDAIAPVDLPQVTYWHVELDQHDVLLAEGLPAESYLDAGDRHAFGEDGIVTLHPRFGWLARDAESCAPLVVTGRVIARLRADLGRRAARQRARLCR